MKWQKHQWAKNIVAASLSLSIALSGAVALMPQQADAAAKVWSTTLAKKATGYKIIKTGEKYLGTPYKFGSSSSTTRTFDCSSFVQRVFKENGYSLPRTSRDQYRVGTKISRKNLRVGDLVFFSTRATQRKSGISKIGHVGIYAGNNKILHTFGAGGVKYSSMASGWWDDHYLGAVRILRY